jgi:hypothetical protein
MVLVGRQATSLTLTHTLVHETFKLVIPVNPHIGSPFELFFEDPFNQALAQMKAWIEAKEVVNPTGAPWADADV